MFLDKYEENTTIGIILLVERMANQIEKTEMGGACGTYGGGERCIPDFGGET
jgi:hypothetical protein